MDVFNAFFKIINSKKKEKYFSNTIYISDILKKRTL